MTKKQVEDAQKGSPSTHPSGDERYSAIDRTMKRLKYEKDALLEVLHATQQVFGFLSEDLLIYIASNLRVPVSRVYGVATFYHLFTFEPLGKNNCIICTGTACHVKGSAAIAEDLSQHYDVTVGKTTEDGLLSLNTARCLGSCGLAPVTVINGTVHGKATSVETIMLVDQVLADEVQA
ncbi:MAG: bidirectional hydrogenase complex protein HoxE [Anaerolineales bacterium]|nr:MAG: bidirectional hydrogenase complex protein HoxE [Anaerolineales bacterium]